MSDSAEVECTKYRKYIFIDAADEDAPYGAAKDLLSSMYKLGLRHLGKECHFRLRRLTRVEYPEHIAIQAQMWGHYTDKSVAMVLDATMEGDWICLT